MRKKRREREFDCPTCMARIGSACMRYVERERPLPTSIIAGVWVKMNRYHAARTGKVRDAERDEFAAYVQGQEEHDVASRREISQRLLTTSKQDGG